MQSKHPIDPEKIQKMKSFARVFGFLSSNGGLASYLAVQDRAITTTGSASSPEATQKIDKQVNRVLQNAFGDGELGRMYLAATIAIDIAATLRRALQKGVQRNICPLFAHDHLFRMRDELEKAGKEASVLHRIAEAERHAIATVLFSTPGAFEGDEGIKTLLQVTSAVNDVEKDLPPSVSLLVQRAKKLCGQNSQMRQEVSRFVSAHCVMFTKETLHALVTEVLDDLKLDEVWFSFMHRLEHDIEKGAVVRFSNLIAMGRFTVRCSPKNGNTKIKRHRRTAICKWADAEQTDVNTVEPVKQKLCKELVQQDTATTKKRSLRVQTSVEQKSKKDFTNTTAWETKTKELTRRTPQEQKRFAAACCEIARLSKETESEKHFNHAEEINVLTRSRPGVENRPPAKKKRLHSFVCDKTAASASSIKSERTRRGPLPRTSYETMADIWAIPPPKSESVSTERKRRRREIEAEEARISSSKETKRRVRWREVNNGLTTTKSGVKAEPDRRQGKPVKKLWQWCAYGKYATPEKMHSAVNQRSEKRSRLTVKHGGKKLMK